MNTMAKSADDAANAPGIHTESSPPLMVVIAATIVAIAMFVAIILLVHRPPTPATDAAAKCVAAPGEQCPSPQFLALYDQYHAQEMQILREQNDSGTLAMELQRHRWELAGMADELKGMLQPGYLFNEQTRKLQRDIPMASAPIPNGAVPSAPPHK